MWEDDDSVTCPYCGVEIIGFDFNEVDDGEIELCSSCGQEFSILKCEIFC